MDDTRFMNLPFMSPGLLADHQIKALCTETSHTLPMLSPFVDHCVSSGKISYGLSSYGYDTRLATEFKVFKGETVDRDGSPILIDPKNLDPELYETVETDVLVIPPHGFALGRTVETFRMPEDVLAICFAKSSYARCFTGNTRIRLSTGEYATFEDLVRREAQGIRSWGYAYDLTSGRLKLQELVNPRRTSFGPIVEVTLSTGKTIRCTEDHAILTEDGYYLRAKDMVGKTPRMIVIDPTIDPVTVVSVEPIPNSDQPLYCLTSPTYGNFFLDNGVCVKNCGLVIGVTPIEPGFVGEVTLEMSNTTDHPIKVYANEGVCQFLFLKGSSPCDVTYADRSGKYMYQTGVVPPRVKLD